MSFVSSKAAALAEGVVKAMFMTKLKSMMAVAVLLGVAAFGGGLLMQHDAGAHPGHVGKVEVEKTAAVVNALQKKDATKAEQQNLQGTWNMVEAERHGKR